MLLNNRLREAARDGQWLEVATEQGHVVIPRVRVAASHAAKLKGLMFKPTLPEDEGLLLVRCTSIHTCSMRFPIDVLFLTDAGQVVHIIHAMTPWRVSPVVRGAQHVLECNAHTMRRIGIRLGQRLLFTALDV